MSYLVAGIGFQRRHYLAPVQTKKWTWFWNYGFYLIDFNKLFSNLSEAYRLNTSSSSDSKYHFIPDLGFGVQYNWNSGIFFGAKTVILIFPTIELGYRF